MMLKMKNQQIGRAQSELQSHSDLVCRLLLEKKKTKTKNNKKKNKKTIKGPKLIIRLIEKNIVKE